MKITAEELLSEISNGGFKNWSEVPESHHSAQVALKWLLRRGLEGSVIDSYKYAGHLLDEEMRLTLISKEPMLIRLISPFSTENYEKHVLVSVENSIVAYGYVHPSRRDRDMAYLLCKSFPDNICLGYSSQDWLLKIIESDKELQELVVAGNMRYALSFPDNTFSWTSMKLMMKNFCEGSNYLELKKSRKMHLLVKMLKEGEFPETFDASTSVDEAAAFLVVYQEKPHQSVIYEAFLLSSPIKDVVNALYRFEPGVKILSGMYSVKELSPFFKDFPLLPGSVLEDGLGM